MARTKAKELGPIKDWSTLIKKMFDEFYHKAEYMYDSEKATIIQLVEELFQNEQHPNGDQIVKFFEVVRESSQHPRHPESSYDSETKPFHKLLNILHFLKI